MNLFFSVFLFLSSLHSLELKRVILSTNHDPTYIQFWPIVAPLWEAMGLRPTLILVAGEDCAIDTSLGDVIRFPPVPDLTEALQTQALRLLVPTLFPEDGCLIADIDMLPISRSYFFEGANPSPTTAFLVYRDRAYQDAKWPMCYVAAPGYVFRWIFGVSHIAEFAPLLRKWAALGLGWNTDEFVMYAYVTEWEKKGGLVFRLGQGVAPRLDRNCWERQMNFLKTGRLDVGMFIDCHCPRPYSSYRESIDSVIQAIFTQWEREDRETSL